MIVLREDQNSSNNVSPEAVASAIAIGADSANWRAGMGVQPTLAEVQLGGRQFLQRRVRRGRRGRRGNKQQASAEATVAAETTVPETATTTTEEEQKPASSEQVVDTAPTVVQEPAPRVQNQRRSAKPMARFISDVTVRDGTELPPDTPIRKTWRLRNDGSSVWPEGCRLRSVGGDRMGGPQEGVPVVSTSPGEEVDITVSLQTPAAPGRYVGYWRLQTPEGTNFGHRVWVDIAVSNAPSSPIAAAAPSYASVVAEQQPSSVPVCEKVPSSDVPPSNVELAQPVSQTQPGAVAVADLVQAAAENNSNQQRWRAEVSLLVGMGFYDREQLVTLLDAERGSVERVVEHLLQ